MNVAICDDNIDYINTIENYFDKLKPQKLEHDIFMSGEELVYAYEHNKASYDAVFLDMEMAKLDGIETANRIRKIDSNVIIVFVTSHTKYMQRSFECAPFRFLVKPVDFRDFEKVYNEVCIKLKDKPETIVFMENRDRMRIYCSDIIFFESSAHHMHIHTINGTVHKIRKTMTELEKTIDENLFCRVHRAYVVNISHIYKISDNSVEMHNYNHLIPVGRTYKKKLEDKFLNFKERKYLL